MGIQGLLPLLKDAQKSVHVSSYAGKTLGIDAYVWLHRGAYGCAREIVLGDPTPRYIAHALSRIRMLQHFGVKPYLVFDGDKLPAKRGTEDDREQRRSDNLQRARELEQQGNMQQARDVYGKCVDITPEMAFQLIKVLKEQGIPYVVAPYEADAQLAYLEAQGIIDAVITEDSDLLVFGCKTVLFKLDQAGNAVEMLQQLDPAAYRPFNMVVVDNRDGYWLRNLGDRIEAERLPPGISMITASDRNDRGSVRIRHYLPLWEEAERPNPDRGDWRAWTALLGSRQGEAGSEVFDAMNIFSNTGFGTVSSSLIALPSVAYQNRKAIWRFCGGHPDRGEWTDIAL